MLGQVKSAGSSVEDIESLPVARVELERRRIDKHGRLKQKLSVVGVQCVDCNVSVA